ncbi:cupin domain-containing protein [Microbispora sp. H10670]|uniref:cupin domain-containing protein n=1 Tax=Microbispora sp. H10670 TaxID=2729108 RepID=UPI002872DF22|nr:cupin domain-containing protein [Microbispora sp. H10670]
MRIRHWPYDEVCVIQTGRVAIEDADGGRVEFGPGAAFLMPAGFDGRWHTLEPTCKIFVGVSAR